MEEVGQIYIPRRARRYFGRGAWTGTVLPGSESDFAADRSIGDPTPRTPPDPPSAGIRHVDDTRFSAGNRWRFPVVVSLREWWRFSSGDGIAGSSPDRGVMGRRGPTPDMPAGVGPQYFVANPAIYSRIANRRMARQGLYSRLVPNRQAVYVAPVYGASAPVQDYTTLAGAKAARARSIRPLWELT